MVGVGFPSALQLSVAGSCFFTTTLSGCSVIRGGRNCAKKENDLKFYFIHNIILVYCILKLYFVILVNSLSLNYLY